MQKFWRIAMPAGVKVGGELKVIEDALATIRGTAAADDRSAMAMIRIMRLAATRMMRELERLEREIDSADGTS
jgi:hypothetical protein